MRTGGSARSGGVGSRGGAMCGRGSDGGFTLVELLVVVGIIALLVGALLPALSRARDYARLATCVSNPRQITAAAVAFTADHDGFWPVQPLRTTPSVAFNSWQYGGKTNSDHWRTSFGGLNHVPVEKRPLNPYVYPDTVLMDDDVGDGGEAERKVELRVFECPSDAGTYQRQFWNGNTFPDPRITSYDDVGTSYHLNVKWWYASIKQSQQNGTWGGSRQHWARTKAMFKWANFHGPSHFVWIHDQTMDFVSETGYARNGDHKGLNKATAAFMDGHVRHLVVEPGAAVTSQYRLIFDESTGGWQRW